MSVKVAQETDVLTEENITTPIDPSIDFKEFIKELIIEQQGGIY